MPLPTLSRDALARILHTFTQAFIGSFGIAYAASGLNVAQVVDISSAEKFGLAVCTAALAAALSAAKGVLKSYLAGGLSASDLATLGPDTVQHNPADEDHAVVDDTPPPVVPDNPDVPLAESSGSGNPDAAGAAPDITGADAASLDQT